MRKNKQITVCFGKKAIKMPEPEPHTLRTRCECVCALLRANVRVVLALLEKEWSILK